jgi:SWI/SNF-related matrix-associated actin-dependent regulator of chromatin subfamily A member 5
MSHLQIKTAVKILSDPTISNNKKYHLLRKNCHHPYLINGCEDDSLPVYGEHIYENSGKMSVFHKLVTKLINEEHKILAFTFHKNLLDIIEDYC